jgi:Protein of unknown function (DUF1573)
VKTVYLLFSLLLSALISASVQAELKWDQTTIELKPTVTDKQAIAHFKYQNVGKTPIQIKSLHASCGCTAVQSQKDKIAPGGKGEVTATFNIGDRTGLQVKTITVDTDDPTHPQSVLTLKADVPQVLNLQPNFVYWQAGEEAKSKTIMATAGKDIPIKKLDVSSMNPQFKAKVEPGVVAGQFKIDIQPTETDKPAFTTVVVKSDYPKTAPKTFFITARVMGTPVAPAAAATRIVPPPLPPARVAATPAPPGH